MALEYYDGNELVIEADLPGIDPDRDIEVSISNDILHIRACRASGVDLGGRPSDLRWGTFVRDIALPSATAEDQVRATYRNGQLVVRAPAGGPRKVASVRIAIVHA